MENVEQTEYFKGRQNKAVLISNNCILHSFDIVMKLIRNTLNRC